MRASEGPDRELARLIRAVRRVTIAVWCATVLLAAMFALPWLTFLARVRRIPLPAQAASLEQDGPSTPYFSDFDDGFRARSPEEKIRRATVILVTQTRPGQDQREKVVTEVIKRSPGVRSYYKLFDDDLVLQPRRPGAICHTCEPEERVVFMVGNPAFKTSSSLIQNGRIQAMGGLSLVELRELARRQVESAD